MTARSLSALSRNTAEDTANWSLYESTEQLQAECQKGEISKRVHPEFQSTSAFPIGNDKAARECFALNVVMDPDYEQLIDRGTALEKNLCAANSMTPLYNLRPDLHLTAHYEELARVTTEFHKRLEAEMKKSARESTERFAIADGFFAPFRKLRRRYGLAQCVYLWNP